MEKRRPKCGCPPRGGGLYGQAAAHSKEPRSFSPPMFLPGLFARRAALAAGLFFLLPIAGAWAQSAGRETTVRCVYYTKGDGPTRGGTAPVTVRVAPNSTGMPHVYCPESGGATSGEMRSSAWVAAFCASYATNH